MYRSGKQRRVKMITSMNIQHQMVNGWMEEEHESSRCNQAAESSLLAIDKYQQFPRQGSQQGV